MLNAFIHETKTARVYQLAAYIINTTFFLFHEVVNSKLINGRVVSGDDRICGQVVRVPGYRFEGPGSIPGATRFSEKQWV
jgi:hypothetical protein